MAVGRATIRTYCALCISRCGATATVEDGKLVGLHADPDHPTGQALCMKGKAAPELVASPDRLLLPQRRTGPKGARDPGWQAISWDEALDTTASRLRELERAHGAAAVAFTSASPSTSAIADSIEYLIRLRRAFGSPHFVVSMELCGWGRYFAPGYTFGTAVPGAYLPDIENAGCILYWGYNPSVARIAHATATTAALSRGAKLIVVDPRRAGLAHKADVWLRVRPGTDATLALAIGHVMLKRGWFDRAFVQRWTNAAFLVDVATGRFVRVGNRFVAWNEARGEVADPQDSDAHDLALAGDHEVTLAGQRVRCRPALALVAEACARAAAQVETVTGVTFAEVERAAETMWSARPVAYYTWSGIEQHRDATQIARAIAIVYALTGSLDARGGNVLFPSVPQNPIAGDDLLAPAQRSLAAGLDARPLGPARWEFVTTDDLYRAAEARQIRGVVGFGANLVMAHADGARARDALAGLDFYVHADLFMTPTAELADIVLPVATPFETEALKIGFEVSGDAQSLVQLRTPLVAPRGEARSDLQIIFALATRLGLGDRMWNGDIAAALSHQLAPSGVTLDELRATPGGVHVPLETRYRKYEERGFTTPSGRIELYSETLLAGGHAPVPEITTSAANEQFPLVLTSAKSTYYCESQHRNLPSLRRRAPEPYVDLHPETARARAIAEGDWVRIETPHGSVRARARFDPDLAPDVVVGQHGWWQACAQLDLPGYDPYEAAGVNLNLVARHTPSDPISGSVPLRSQICNVVRA